MPLSREDAIRGLTQFAEGIRNKSRGKTTVNIVGGAALQLAYTDRLSTEDIDAQIIADFDVKPVIDDIAATNGWNADWLNDAVVNFWPPLVDYEEWTVFYEDDHVRISIAPAELLLAMKALAARPGRDTKDLVDLIRICRVASIHQVEEIVEGYFPGDAISERAVGVIERILAEPR